MQITLATLPQVRAQAVFDHCARHLLTQMKHSRRYSEATGNLACAYRGDSGRKCVAGACIADDEYRPLMDDPRLLAQHKESVTGSLAMGEAEHGVTTKWANLVELGLVPKAHAQLIGWLQLIHDDHPPHEWASELGQLATTFNLSPAVLSETLH